MVPEKRNYYLELLGKFGVGAASGELGHPVNVADPKRESGE
jgi:hypothetical protein